MTSGRWPGQAPPICLELKQFHYKQVCITPNLGLVTLSFRLVGAVTIAVVWVVSVAMGAFVGVREMVSLGAVDISAVESDAVTIWYLLLPF